MLCLLPNGFSFRVKPLRKNEPIKADDALIGLPNLCGQCLKVGYSVITPPHVSLWKSKLCLAKESFGLLIYEYEYQCSVLDNAHAARQSLFYSCANRIN